MAAKINYKMGKQDKIMLSMITDPHRRGEVRRIVVSADIHAMTVPKTNPLDKDKKRFSRGGKSVPAVDHNASADADIVE